MLFVTVALKSGVYEQYIYILHGRLLEFLFALFS
ncbi:MAG: hypothetical protein ACJAT7_003718, partial [Psychromonas sp.]